MDEIKTEVTEHDDHLGTIHISNYDEGGRGCRNKKRQTDPVCCPVCCVTLRNTEVESHLNAEVEKLNRVPTRKDKSNLKNLPSSSNGSDNCVDRDKNWETYQKVRSNRHSRQRQKTRKRKADETICPICNKETTEDISIHVEICLRRSENRDIEDSDESIDVEAYEEYEWAGESRIRATSLLPGGAASLGTTVSMCEEDEDLNVDVDDDSQVYGVPQYSESDIIYPCGDATDAALRKAVGGSDQAEKPVSEESPQTEREINGEGGDPVVEVLKNRIKELERKEQNKDEVFKCLICMDRYRTPVISICCWHVHCEQCWLQTLGVKKLCPQCNMITSPADLRKIFM